MIDENKLIEEIKSMIRPLLTPDGTAYFDDAIQAHNETIVDVLNAIEQQPKVGEWIPVDEGLPEEHEIVDITYVNETYEYEDDGDLFYIEMLTDIAYYEDGEWFDEFDELIIEDVIAWKPRPEPYRKEDKLMKEVKCLLDGHALLEYIGNYYEYVGSENGKFIFQNVNDDSHIKLSYEQLLLNDIYRLIQKGR